MSIVIVGAGPNLGLAIGRRFGREGLPVGLVVARPGQARRRSPASSRADGITAARRGRRHPRRADALARRIDVAGGAARPGRGRSSTRRCPRASS